MNTVTHNSRSHEQRGQTVMPVTDDVAFDPAYQEMIRRLLQHGVGDTNASYVDRVEVAVRVASVIRQRRDAR